MKGIFITFEGTEGSGKTTVIEKIEQTLLKMNYPVIKTREPGGSKIAEEIRNIILDVENVHMDPATEALLYAASRRQHLVEKVLPYLEKGYIVLSDRYIDSSLAYQGYARELGIDEIYQINQFATHGLLPDLTIYIDVKPEVGLTRIHHNHREENRLDLEKVDFHQKVYQGYQIIAHRFPERFRVIDGENDREKVYQDAFQWIQEIIQKRG